MAESSRRRRQRREEVEEKKARGRSAERSREEGPSTTRAQRNEIFKRRRTDVGRCFYERPAVYVDVNYIGGHEAQIVGFVRRARTPVYVYERGLLLNGLGLGRQRGYRVSLSLSLFVSPSPCRAGIFKVDKSGPRWTGNRARVSASRLRARGREEGEGGKKSGQSEGGRRCHRGMFANCEIHGRAGE